jgi:hypothetical protein
MDFDDSCQVDEATVRQFIRTISDHATRAINGNGSTGVLQLYRVNPLDEKNTVPSRFQLDDVEHMVQTALNDATAGHNVYIEARTVRKDLKGNKRGGLGDTVWVLGLVIDSDADKDRAGDVTAKPSLAVETSRGNYHLWYLFDRAIPADQAQQLGKAIRESAGADHDTGVITQGYRVAGTPNFPSTSKRKRGRISIEPTRIIEHTGRLWKPEELLAAFPLSESPQASTGQADDDGDETTLPDDLLDIIKNGVAPGVDRSAQFHGVVAQLKKRNWSVDAIVALMEEYPNGIGCKYSGRLREEVERSFDKVAGVIGKQSNTGTTGTAQAAAAATPPHVIPTIRLVPGQLPRAVAEAEHALLATGLPIFTRAGTLVHPVTQVIPAADGHQTRVARLRSFCADSLLEWVADAALFQRFDLKRRRWIDTNPPHQVVKMLLAREARWAIPRVNGVITTPTLRADGSLLAAAGYDARSELYLLSGLTLPAIPDQPTREEAQAALQVLMDLFAEFSFKQPLDRVVAISGLLTALVRGSLATAPLYLIRAHSAGTGKSYLVDVIAAVVTGRLCPVITASKNEEETEKRLGTIILSGISIVSLDNCMRDLDGELLCQLTERPLVKIRILGRSEMPECECHTTVFATGNNILLKGDMIRRGLQCNLDALTERPELREFKYNPLHQVLSDRGVYVAAALTIIRAYLAAEAPTVCSAFGSYVTWSRMVRSPLVWLGQPDPVKSTDSAREEDPTLADIRELFSLWLDSLEPEQSYTTAQIIETACATPPSGDFNPQPFKELLLRVAGDKGNVSPERLGWWLRKISGRVVGIRAISGHVEYRLNLGRLNTARACYSLRQVS